MDGTTATIRRYDRQTLIEGWNQEKLKNGAVTIVGSDVLARYIALSLTALGIGKIRVIDSSAGLRDEILLDLPLAFPYRAKSLEQTLMKINPNVNIHGVSANLTTRATQYYLQGSQVIVDATNDPVSKSHVLDYHNKTKVPVISASCDETKGKIVYVNDLNSAALMQIFEGKKQGDLVALELGGVVGEEVKKVVMGNGGNIGPLVKPYNYNLESSILFSNVSDIEIKNEENPFADKNILMIGAGALGCFLAPATVVNLKPKRLDIMDYDTVEEHNLNRQVCYYNSVGKLKAESLVEVLKKSGRGTKLRAIADKFTENFETDTKYDLIFDAVDSFYTKLIVHDYAMKRNIPVISGGTDFRAATVLVYKIGDTSCFDCQINLRELGYKAELVRRASCLMAPNPSVIMTNQIAGAIMVAQARNTLRSDLFGKPVNGIIKYIADFESRGGVDKKEKICDCNTKEIKPMEFPNAEKIRIIENVVNGRVVQEVLVDGQKV